MAETFDGQELEPGEHEVDYLVVVLNYDDLLAEPPVDLFVLDRQAPVSLGRAEEGERGPRRDGPRILLADSWVSGIHARLVPCPRGVRLVDQESRNGTRVYGEPVVARELADGDLIEVGHTLLLFRRARARQVEELLDSPGGFELGPSRTRSVGLAETVRQLRRIATTGEPVLVLGETGTGKELVANALHAWSGRPGALRAVDCGAVPESLFESTFFGHRRGAFTGAHEPRVGEVVLAHHGTLFLDEVANTGLASQAKLLRTLETGRVTPLGAIDSEEVDFRLVAATNHDVLARPESFRIDLLNRLSGFVVRLPALRERREDLGALTRQFLLEAGAPGASIRPAAARALFCSSFPGNVRQLRALLRGALVLAAGEPIDAHHLSGLESLPLAAGPSPEASAEAAAGTRAPPPAEIEAVLAREAGNVSRAARVLSVHARQLYRWMERYEIDPKKHRSG